MKSETLLTLGAIAAGGYIVYKLTPQLMETLKPTQQVTGAVGDVAEHAGGAVTSWLDLINTRTYTNIIETKTQKTLEETQKELSTPKYVEGKGVGLFDTTGTYGLGFSTDTNSKQIKSTQDFNNPVTQKNLQNLFSGTKATQPTTKPIQTVSLPVQQKEKDLINKAYSIFGVKTKII